MTGYLAPLTRTELDVLTADLEAGLSRAHIALRAAPLQPARLAAACGVAQDVTVFLNDCYDESVLRLAAEMERLADDQAS